MDAERDRRWHRPFGPSEANIIFVAPDWSDLEATISYLEAHPDIAKDIAQRQRKMMVDDGFLSPASETCYWRALIRAWSSVARTDVDEKWGKWDDEGPESGEGMRWETFSLTGKLKWP